MEFNYTERITEVPKFDASKMPKGDEWTDELAFSAVVWLSQKLGKPILQLTSADYDEAGLKELAALQLDREVVFPEAV